MANPFVNRITGYGTKPADQFEPNPLNYRTHPQRQRDAVQASLRELGWIGVVVENKTTGRLLDGHERVWQALANNEEVPYVEVELSEAEERLALAVFDPIGAMAETDSAILDALLRDVNTGEAALQALLSELATDAGLYGDEPSNVDAEPQIDKAEELRQKWQVQTGQLWQLGEHRLICGDCTDAAVVARVMGGEKATLCLTDPPYSVNYDRSQSERGGNEGVHAHYTEADIDPAQLLTGFLAIVPSSLMIMSYPVDRHFFALADALKSSGFAVRKELIWVKDTFSFWPGSQYQQRHEPILLCTKNGATMNADVPANESTVFEIKRPKAHDLHPTAKPIELWVKFVQYHTSASDLVYEPFSGSGTTIIACEQLGRKCRAIEISPAYCAVALQRFFDATNKLPVLVSS